MTKTKANSSSATKRRVLATVLTLAASHGMSDGATYAVCVACGRNALVGIGAREGNRFELGHVDSDSNGGEYSPANLLPLCRACNVAIGSENMTDVLTPRYDSRKGWNGTLVADPGTKVDTFDARAAWLPAK
jgi:hypothetical protein